MFNVKKIIVSAATLAAVAMTAPAFGDDVVHFSQNASVKVGMTAMNAGDWDKASKFLTRASKESLTTEIKSDVLNNLCVADLKRGEFAEALEACDRAIRLDRSNWHAYTNRGTVKLIMGYAEEAKADFDRAITLNPKADLPKQLQASATRLSATQFASK